ncbi:MAG: T9SS type B sorting domain-containing protein [Bacteroidia bacterium]
MKKYLVANILFLLSLFVSANNHSINWEGGLYKQRSFIENKGQFDIRNYPKDVKFAFNGGSHVYYFTPNEVIIELSQKKLRDRTDIEKEQRKKEKEKGFKSLNEWQEFQKKDFGKRIEEVREVLITKWINSNLNSNLEAIDKTSDYHSYVVKKNGQYENINNIPAYKKLLYKNLYQGIDVLYELHPEIGFKYSLIVHPGADVSQVSLEYSKPFVLNSDGTIRTHTALGDIIDHAPVTFYADNKNNVIPSKYKVNGNKISFELANYDITKSIIIDPWTQTPSFATNWDCVWECEKDGAGNVYIIGGVMPLQLLKYNAGGTLQWTYNTPYDTTMWLGTFATDNAGNSYVTNGSNAMIQKISTTGALVWNNSSPGGLFSSTEFWNIAFNCDQTRLIVGGTGGTLPPLPYIYEIDMNSGNVVSSVQVTSGALMPTQEVRSITACGNGKYFYLTHDTLGYIHQNLTSCNTSGGSNVKFPHNYALEYKCENYRYNNSGIMAVRYYNGFVYIHRGNQLHKRNFINGTLIASVNIPGGSFVSSFGRNQVGCSGIDIDNCGNIYVGSTNAVVKFDQNLTQLASYPTSFNVYDVHVNTNGEVIACGATGNSNSSSRTGYIVSIAASACTTVPLTCCDATICPVGPVCTTTAPFNLNPIQSGGTFSGPGVSPTGNFNPAAAGVGTHTIVYTLACGSDSIQITVYNCTPLSLCQETNGQLTVSGGTAPYTWYQWQNGSSTPITNQTQCLACNPSYTWVGFPLNQCLNGAIPVSNCVVPAGYVQFATGATVTPTSNFPIKVVSANGDSIVINSLSGIPSCSPQTCPTITINTTVNNHVSCFGGNNGSATVSVTGGTAPYTYTWQPGNLSGATQNSLSAGTYTVYVTHSGNCTDSATVVITQPSSAVNAVINTFNNTSCTANTGSATVSVSGGTAPYTYSWSPSGGNAATASGLGVGTYTVTVTDNNGCQDTAMVNISTLNGPVISNPQQTNVTCFGLSNGTASVTVSGGTAPYTYSWSPFGGNAASASGLSAGTYTVTVTDNAGCSATQTFNITEPAALVATTNSVTPANCGVSNGAASISVTGGTGTYTYSWSPSGGSAASATGLAAGTYVVTVTDQNGCQDTANVIITTIGGPTINVVTQNNVSCNGGSDGSITVSASGANPPYSYLWSPTGGNASTANNLSAGTYTVTVTDSLGCVSVQTFTISQPNPIVPNATTTPANCATNDGSITLNASGGTAPYTYSWSPGGSTNSSISNLTGGVYTVTITDANNCTYTGSVTVPVTGSLNIDISPTTATIIQGDSVQLIASGQSNYTYSWSPSLGLSCNNCPNPFASPNVTTVYYVTVTDGSGCSGTDSILITVDIKCGEVFFPTIFSPNNDGLNDVQCVLGNCIGAIEWAVYSRWGEKLFETTDPKACWDGTYKGKPMNTGVYVYKLRAVLFNGDIVEQQGNFTITR